MFPISFSGTIKLDGRATEFNSFVSAESVLTHKMTEAGEFDFVLGEKRLEFRVRKLRHPHNWNMWLPVSHGMIEFDIVNRQVRFKIYLLHAFIQLAALGVFLSLLYVMSKDQTHMSLRQFLSFLIFLVSSSIVVQFIIARIRIGAWLTDTVNDPLIDAERRRF